MSKALSVQDVCERFGIGVHTVLGWIAAGELRAVNVGRTPVGKKPRWRITAEALAAFELARESGTPAPAKPRRKKVAAGEPLKFY